MENLPFDDLDQLATLLTYTFKGTNDEVKQASEILVQMKKSLVRFVDSMTRLISTDQTDQKIMNVKNSACLTLCMAIETVKEKKSFSAAKDYVLEAVLKTMMDRNVQVTLKLSLQRALDELYKVDKGRDLRNKSLLFVKDNMRNGGVNEYCASYIILQSIMGAASSNSITADYFKNIQEEFVLSASNLITGISAEIKEAINSANPSEKISNMFIGFRTLKFWAGTLHAIICKLGRKTKTSQLHFEYVQTISGYEPILEVLSNILMMQIPTGTQVPQCLFSTAGVIGVDQILNGVKIYVLKCINKVLSLSENAKLLQDPQTNKFYMFAMNAGFEGVLQSLFAFCENGDLNIEKALDDQELEECVVECLKLLVFFTGEKSLYNVFINCYPRLLVNVCLPLMRTRPSELEKFEINPEEFAQFACDVCSEQKSLVAKSEAAKLLEHICDDIDGAQTFLMTILLGSMQYSLLGDNLEGLDDKLKVLEQFKNTLFIARTEPKIRMETCIMALCVVSYIVVNREDLIADLDIFMETYKDLLYTDSCDVLIRSRMCLLVDYYFDILFRTQAKKDLCTMQLSFVIECATIEDPRLQALSQQGIEALAHIFTLDSNRPKIGRHIDLIVRKIAAFSAVAQNKNFFTIIDEILAHYRKRLLSQPELIGLLIDGLVKRLLVSYPEGKQPRNSQKIIVTTIWNILSDVANDGKYIPGYQADIEKVMEPLFQAFQNNDKVPFENDLLYYVQTVTKKAKNVSPICWEVLKCYPKIFARDKQLLSGLLCSLNQLIIHGKEVLEKEPEFVHVLIEMGLQGLRPTHSRANEANSCEGALLLQLIFQYLSPAISPQDWEAIITGCIEKLSEIPPVFVQIKLGGVIMCGFMSNFQITYAIVQHQKKMMQMMSLYLDEASNYEYAYDRKILLLGLSTLLTNGINDEFVSSRIGDIFNVLISFLKYVETLEQKRAQWRAENLTHGTDDDDNNEQPEFITVPKEILEKFLTSQTDEQMMKTIESTGMGMEDHEKDGDEEYIDVPKAGDDKEYLDDEEENELKEIMDNFVSNIDTQDEFHLFKKAVAELQHTNEGALRGLLEKLPHNKQEYLKGVFSSKRVVVKEIAGGESQTEARKIVRVRARKVATNVGLPGADDQE